MTIEKLDPPALVIWKCHGDNPEWVGTTLSWEIEPADGGSRPSRHAKRVRAAFRGEKVSRSGEKD
jgi:hypothetical protein